ncbi:MAG: sugar phosphate isomerase/epimerase [Candidatus Methylarchaceae archaeon HK01B]|nr:sugar phosphate isomerase/epimerase [Candidatus Methylarchaceae archaeon HK01B]
MALVGLSSLYIFLKKEVFEDIIKEVKFEREYSQKPDIWEIVDEGHHSLTRKRVRMIHDLSSQGYTFTIHSPYNITNIADLDRSRRHESLAKLKKSIESAAEVEAKALVLHPGLKAMGKDQTIAERLNEESILTLYDYAESSGIVLAFENMNPATQHFMTKPRDFEDFFERNKVRLKMVFDVGHAYIGSVVNEFISKLSDRFVTVHFHDNRGDRDEHLGIGDGFIDWRGVTSQLIRRDFRGMYIIESVVKPYESVAKIKEMLKPF